VSTTFAINDHGIEVTSRYISDVQYVAEELLFSTYQCTDEGFVIRAMEESAATNQEISFISEFSIDDLVTHIIEITIATQMGISNT
jgi:hypothetical protein